MKVKTSLLIIAIVALIATVSVLVFSTYALFSDSQSVGNHLEAGTLKIGLYQTGASGYKIDEQGKLTAFTEEKNVNLRTSDEKIFNLENVAPGVSYSATLKIINEGDTAFTYSVKIVDLVATDTADYALLDYLTVDISVGETSVVSGVSLSAAENALYNIGEVLYSADSNLFEEFTVTVNFPNVSEDGQNAAQSGAVSFDLTVTATQLVSD